MKAKLIPAIVVPALLLALSGPALAGNGNTLYLLQESPAGAADGNSFLSNQTQANYSSIGSEWRAARQSGTGNTANVTITSNCSASSLSHCGSLGLVQDNSGNGAAGALLGGFNLSSQSPNTATVTISGSGYADLQQLGGGNTITTLDVQDAYGSISQTGLNNGASLSVGPGASGTILQAGSSNTASLNVGSGTSGAISQAGTGNSGGLSVTSVGGGGASLVQVGNGHHYSSGVEVTTTTPYVSIYQF